MKNENGHGSVYKLSGKRRKPWVAMVTVEYTLDCKQVRKRVGSYATKREAQEGLLLYNKNPLLFNGTTFKEVMDLWWEGYQKKYNSYNTIKNKITALKKFEKLYDLKIKEINFNTLQNLFDEMNDSHGTKTGYKSTLNMIFEYALKNDLIESNKVQLVDLGKFEAVREAQIFTNSEIAILWKNTHVEYARYLLILIYTGMRVSEFFNVRREDINLFDNTLKVTKSKTKAGIRTIPFTKGIAALIIECLSHGKEYLAINSKQQQFMYMTFFNHYRIALKNLGIEEKNIHSTRHTFATLLNNSDANRTSITKLIGHTNPKMAEDVYTHKDIHEYRKAIDLMPTFFEQ